MRWAEITCASNGTPNCLRMATAFCITSQSEDEPMMTPTSGLFCSHVSLQLLAGQAFDGFEVLGLGFSMTSAGSAGAGAVLPQSVRVSR
jgi:hypothetical protein